MDTINIQSDYFKGKHLFFQEVYGNNFFIIFRFVFLSYYKNISFEHNNFLNDSVYF